MENTPHQEQPTKTPFDFSEYTQPTTPEVVESSTDTPFDFSEYQGGQKSFEETSEEINEHNRLTKGYDFSDENIASGGPILRDLTPTELHGNAEREERTEQLTPPQVKLGSRIAQKLFHRG